MTVVKVVEHSFVVCSGLNVYRGNSMGKNNINVITNFKINALAKMFYSMQGYTVVDGYDFSVAHHPQEQRCWNQAIVAWAVLKDDNSILEYQVG